MCHHESIFFVLFPLVTLGSKSKNCGLLIKNCVTPKSNQQKGKLERPSVSAAWAHMWPVGSVTFGAKKGGIAEQVMQSRCSVETYLLNSRLKANPLSLLPLLLAKSSVLNIQVPKQLHIAFTG